MYYQDLCFLFLFLEHLIVYTLWLLCFQSVWFSACPLSEIQCTTCICFQNLQYIVYGLLYCFQNACLIYCQYSKCIAVPISLYHCVFRASDIVYTYTIESCIVAVEKRPHATVMECPLHGTLSLTLGAKWGTCPSPLGPDLVNSAHPVFV